MLKDLLDRAKRVAEEHLPKDVLDAGRELGRSVAAHAPAPLAEVIHYVTEESEEAKAKAKAEADAREKAEAAKAEAAKAEAAKAEAAKAEAAKAEAAKAEPAFPGREDPMAVLERVKTKAERGLKPEDRLVVVYATPEEDEEVQAILKILEGVEAEVRHNDLRREPQTARQLATLTGVMVPPYVFINGRHWGNRYDLESLAAWGDLPKVVANLLDELSDEARRMGNVHDSYSDEISVENILTRWKLGHILCVDDLDSWYEVDRDQQEHFYYQGGPRPAEDMPAVAAEIVRAVEAEELEAVWQLEPSVHLP
ncbi:hypothetical protein [Paraliomyxa miuraensis]|uniref:hypothetical protein n=1 Tax=Paraliomyxa miuraensis TaxID=376150 RepID=UPI002259373B|nr:hypothetical protein [Paraliomyxa miuraensis]MCX4243810.1 hypothetical protein [Paraliomyxa miuraensis]